MILTGWTEAELRAADPRTVNALHWRVIASRLWSPEVTQALAINVALLKGQDKIRAAKARDAARSLHDVLFPKDD